MKQFKLEKKTGITVGVVGLLLATVLAGGAVWAGKDDDQITVNTNASSCLNAPEDDVMDPVREMVRMQEEMERFFANPLTTLGRTPRRNIAWDGDFARPDMDLREEPDAYHVQMDLPGMNKSGITVEVTDNILTVKAESKRETTKKEGEKLLMQERSRGFVSRSIRLPRRVDADKVSAEYKDGVLRITLPTVQKEPSQKRIAIN